MTSLLRILSDKVGEIFAAQGFEAAYGRVTPSDRPDLAEFQCNGALAAAKAAKKNPREISAIICAQLEKKTDIFSKVESAGPGFINLVTNKKFLEDALKNHSQTLETGAETKIGNGQTVVLDYGGPNIAKPMHVGHLRAAIIGDSVRRIMAYAGFHTLGDVHMGDWGTHLGLLISDYLRKGEEGLVLKAQLENPASVTTLFDDMAQRYPRASAASKEDETLRAEALEATLKIQNKEKPYYELWQKIRDVSILGMKANYDALGIHFDLWKGEADVHDYIAPMVEDLRRRHYAVESEGAWVVPVAQNDDKKEFPPLMLYKRDGAVVYGTTDLATLIERMKLYNPSRIVYVVDQRQGLHFEQVFRAARKTGIASAELVELTHAGFGTMNGPDGKPFKTRAGGVMRLDDLIAMGVEKARARMAEAHLAEDATQEEKEGVAHKVAIAAIKFADLQNQRQADYVFDLDRLTSFEGKTGPYLLYQAVRIKSLLRKADYKPVQDTSFVVEAPDRALALVLFEWEAALMAAIDGYAPHYVCEYAFRLAQAFSSFYAHCHILSEEDPALKQSRLSLCELTYRHLVRALDLVGISVPERM